VVALVLALALYCCETACSQVCHLPHISIPLVNIFDQFLEWGVRLLQGPGGAEPEDREVKRLRPEENDARAHALQHPVSSTASTGASFFTEGGSLSDRAISRSNLLCDVAYHTAGPTSVPVSEASMELWQNFDHETKHQPLQLCKVLKVLYAANGAVSSAVRTSVSLGGPTALPSAMHTLSLASQRPAASHHSTSIRRAASHRSCDHLEAE
jgi:hypothetical protein